MQAHSRFSLSLSLSLSHAHTCTQNYCQEEQENMTKWESLGILCYFNGILRDKYKHLEHLFLKYLYFLVLMFLLSFFRFKVSRSANVEAHLLAR
jgi:hypothetical protein